MHGSTNFDLTSIVLYTHFRKLNEKNHIYHEVLADWSEFVPNEGSDTAQYLLVDYIDERSLRNHLQLGVDAIITNQPEKLANLIQTEFHDTLTLATQETSPWEPIKSSEAINHLHKAAIAGFSGFIAERWFDKKCSKPSDCHGVFRAFESVTFEILTLVIRTQISYAFTVVYNYSISTRKPSRSCMHAS